MSACTNRTFAPCFCCSQAKFCSTPARDKLSSTITVLPSVKSLSATFTPTKPAPPVINVYLISFVGFAPILWLLILYFKRLDLLLPVHCGPRLLYLQRF